MRARYIMREVKGLKFRGLGLGTRVQGFGLRDRDPKTANNHLAAICITLLKRPTPEPRKP